MTLLHILARDLPGRRYGEFHNVHVGLQVGLDPVQLVPGDAKRAVFETEIEVVEMAGGRFDFVGPAVGGYPPGNRWVYLAWCNPADGDFNMFRRARLMLDEVEDKVIRGAALDGAIEATLSLTGPGDLPLGGTIRPPVIRWSSLTAPRLYPPPSQTRL